MKTFLNWFYLKFHFQQCSPQWRFQQFPFPPSFSSPPWFWKISVPPEFRCVQKSSPPPFTNAAKPLWPWFQICLPNLCRASNPYFMFSMFRLSKFKVLSLWMLLTEIFLIICFMMVYSVTSSVKQKGGKSSRKWLA